MTAFFDANALIVVIDGEEPFAAWVRGEVPRWLHRPRAGEDWCLWQQPNRWQASCRAFVKHRDTRSDADARPTDRHCPR